MTERDWVIKYDPIKAQQEKWAGDRRRMECSGCDMPQACAWIQDCAKWQKEQQEKQDMK